jgi:tetratricopeptide (TPR) repeat protein
MDNVKIRNMRCCFTVLVLCLSFQAFAQYQELDKQLATAVKAWDLGEPSQAYQLLTEVIRSRPYFAEPYFLRAQVLQGMGQASEALTDLNILLELNGRHTGGLFFRGQVRNNLGQFALAKKDLEHLLNMPRVEASTIIYQRKGHQVSTAKPISEELVFEQLGIAEMGLGDIQSALVFLNRALRIKPRTSQFLLQRGKAHELMGEWLKAESDYRQALASDPYHEEAHQALAGLIEATGRHLEAAYFFEQAINANPDFVLPYQQRGYQLFLEQDWVAALSDFQKVLELSPEDTEAWFMTAQIYANLDQPHEALRCFGKVLKLNPQHGLALVGLGNIHFQLQRYDEALAAFAMAIFHHPHYKEAYYKRGLTQYQLGNMRQYCNDLMRAAALGLDAALEAWEGDCG